MWLAPFGRLAASKIAAALAVNLAAPVALANCSAVSLPMRIFHGG